MTKEKRIEKLKAVAEQKKENALENTEKAISKMIRENKRLSFSNIAREAGVSISYLYKYPEIKERIQYLRKQQSQTKKTSSPQPASDKSKMVITKQFKERIKKLEAQRDGLRRAVEGLTGKLYHYQEIEEQLERIKAQNSDLKEQLEECRSRNTFSKHESTVDIFQKQNEKLSMEIERLTQENVELKNKLARNTLKSTNKVTQVKRPTIPVPDSVKAELKELKIKINSTLRKLIRENPEVIILESIDALKYAILKNEVKNPSGFLVKAIKYRWKAPENISKEKETTTQQENEFPEGFEE